jgi:hypothetical protein
MKTIDRRRLVRGLLFGAGAASLALTPGAAMAMPLDDRLPGALDDWVDKAQVVVVGPGPRAAAASGAAGGTGAVASAAGAGCRPRPQAPFAQLRSAARRSGDLRRRTAWD